MQPVKTWVVFFTYGLATVAVLLASIVAGMVLHTLHPEVEPAALFEGLPGLIAGASASAAALLFTILVAARGMPASRLRLTPGRERGRDLAWMVLGMLALGQALDSLAMLTGVADRGSIETVRRALAGASGLALFAAVLVVGVAAPAAEEIFFRGYMQSLLAERWSRGAAIGVTSVCFAALHIDPVHAVLALALGVYLGFVADLSGSALPAVTCHIANNTAFTLLAALVGPLRDAVVHQAALAAATLLLIGCIVALRRSLREP